MYRVQPASRPVESLIGRTGRSYSWTEGEERECHACSGSGTEVVHGEETSCRVCRGSGRLEWRRGVSCCSSLADLRRYFARRSGGPDSLIREQMAGCVVVELEGDLSDDEDHDAPRDRGVVLVYPTRIVAVHADAVALLLGRAE